MFEPLPAARIAGKSIVHLGMKDIVVDERTFEYVAADVVNRAVLPGVRVAGICLLIYTAC